METQRERNKFVIPGAGVARIQVVALNKIKEIEKYRKNTVNKTMKYK